MLIMSFVISKSLPSVFRQSHKCIGIAKMSQHSSFQTLSISVPKEFVYHVKLNRPDKVNAMNGPMWMELKQCFDELSEDEDCRSIVLSAEGKLFTAGIDLSDFVLTATKIADKPDVSRKAKVFQKLISDYQASMTSIELCKKPVLAAVHSACIGAGVDMITAADMRYCTKDAWFQVKEVDVGLAADVGTLQRLPKVLGSDSLARELCFTARKMLADEAMKTGLVSRVFDSREEMIQTVEGIAESIARKSPVAIQNTKASLVYSRDHSVQEGLDHIALLNQLHLQSEDLIQAAMGQMSKDDVIVFSKL